DGWMASRPGSGALVARSLGSLPGSEFTPTARTATERQTCAKSLNLFIIMVLKAFFASESIDAEANPEVALAITSRRVASRRAGRTDHVSVMRGTGQKNASDAVIPRSVSRCRSRHQGRRRLQNSVMP